MGQEDPELSQRGIIRSVHCLPKVAARGNVTPVAPQLR